MFIQEVGGVIYLKIGDISYGVVFRFMNSVSLVLLIIFEFLVCLEILILDDDGRFPFEGGG